MRIARFNLGEQVSVVSAKPGGFAYSFGGFYFHLSEPKRELPQNEISYLSDPPRGPNPFTSADFGDRDRLVWPAGACSIAHEVMPVTWKQRYGMWFEGSELFAVDATETLLARIELPIAVGPMRSHRVGEHEACIQTDRDIVVIALADLERLFAGSAGSLRVEVRELYPHERPTAKVRMFVEYIFTNSAYLVDRDTGAGRLDIPLVPGLEQGNIVTLHHELMRNQYREIEVPGYDRVTLAERRPSFEHPCPCFVAPAIDPAGTLAAPSTAVRAEELERIFVQIADDPDDDAARIVAVDLLEEAGEPYAPQLARLVAGETDEDARREALGTLASYLRNIEWRGNLPFAAELSSSAPNDEAIGDLVAADYRLGFFHTLRLGAGNFRVYCKLVGSRRALGLRHVDGSRLAILQALIAAGRRDLQRLSNLKFATREVLDALVDPTFDGVAEIETETQVVLIGRLLDYIARDERTFFARTKRHLFLHERDGMDEALIEPVRAAWPRLPLDAITVGSVTMNR